MTNMPVGGGGEGEGEYRAADFNRRSGLISSCLRKVGSEEREQKRRKPNRFHSSEPKSGIK